MTEEWTRWEPLKGLSHTYYLDSLIFSENKLIIELIGDPNVKKIQIRFDSPIQAYRYTEESVCFGIFGELSKKYGGDFYANWTFFKIEKSDYIQWLSEQSLGYSDTFNFMHFFIKGSDELVDVLATYEPEVRFIE